MKPASQAVSHNNNNNNNNRLSATNNNRLSATTFCEAALPFVSRAPQSWD